MFKYVVTKVLEGLTEGYEWVADLVVRMTSSLVDFVAFLFGMFATMGESSMYYITSWLWLFPSVDENLVGINLEVINYFFPLNEVVGMAETLLGLWILVFIYRLVKSWIPGIG